MLYIMKREGLRARSRVNQTALAGPQPCKIEKTTKNRQIRSLPEYSGLKRCAKWYFLHFVFSAFQRFVAQSDRKCLPRTC